METTQGGKQPLLEDVGDLDQDRDKIDQFQLQFERVQQDFSKIETFYDALKA